MQKLSLLFQRLVIEILMISAGIAATVIVARESSVEDYYLVPFSYTLCCIFFYRVISYHERGVGLKVLYGVLTCRYCLCPVMNAITNNISNEQFYTRSILLVSMEIFTIFATIAYSYKRIERRQINLQGEREKLEYEKLSFGGFMIIAALVGLMVLRGNGEEIWGSMRFFLATTSIGDTSQYDSYSIIALQCIKNFACILIVSFFKKQYDRNGYKIWPIMSLIVAALCFMIYFGNNRSSILQNAIACIMMVLVCFPEERNGLVLIITPIAALMAISLIFFKQYGIDITTGSIQGATTLKGAAITLDAYFCGINNVAHGLSVYKVNGMEFGIGNFIRDITDNVFLFKIPGFTWINGLFSGYATSTSLVAGISTSMVSTAVQSRYYGGVAFGWLVDIIGLIIVIRMLINFDLHVKHDGRISMIYVYTWMASLFGMIPMYCYVTLLWSSSNVPFFIVTLLFFNKIGKRIVFKIGSR